MLSLFGLKKFPLKSAGFLTMAFSAEVEVVFAAKFSEGFCCLDWALCHSCLYVELQLLGCTVCCQVFPVFWLQICLNGLLLRLCFSRALIPSAKSFWGVLLFWTELCVVPASVLSFSRRAALSAAKYLLVSCLQFSSKELLLMSNLSALLLIFLHTQFYSRLYKFWNL